MSQTAAVPADENPRKAGQWGVKDMNARTGARTHEPVIGFPYALRHDRFTWMPAEHAAHFLRDDSFVVVDASETVKPPLPSQAVQVAGRNTPVLEPGQVVARVDELENGALLARCLTMPGGEKFTTKTKRETMIRFLTGQAEARAAAAAKPEPDEFDPELEPVSDAEAKMMLDGKGGGAVGADDPDFQ